jgi:hypothetical protein
MNLGGLDVFIERALAIAAATCATLLFSFVAAWYGLQRGAQQDATFQDKSSAMLGGCLVGVALAALVGFALMDAAASAGLVLCPIIGGAMSYFIARDVASGPYALNKNSATQHNSEQTAATQLEPTTGDAGPCSSAPNGANLGSC